LPQRQEVLEGIANNQDAPTDDRMETHNLAAELAHAIFLLYRQYPVELVRRHEFLLDHSSIIRKTLLPDLISSLKRGKKKN
jgi:hypothetical protein